MSKYLIIKNTGIYTIVLIMPQITGFLLLPIYTRFLTPADYAIISLVGSFTAIVGIFIALQLQSGIARYILQFMAREQKQEAREFLTSVIVIMVAAMIIFFVVLEYSGDSLVKFTYPKSHLSYHPYFQLSLLTVMLTALYQAPMALFKSLQMAKHFLLMSSIVLFSSILLNIYFVVVRHMGVYGVFLGGVLGSLIGCIVSFFMIRDWFCRKFIWQYIPLALAFSIPLIPHSLGTYLFTTSNRIILEKFVSLSEIGLFSIADRLSSIPLLLVGAFNVAYNPHFIQMVEHNEQEAISSNCDVIGYWWVATLGMVLGFILFVDSILKVMSTKAYYAASGVACILVFSSIFRGLYCFAVSPLFFKKKTYLVPLITLVAGGISVWLNIWAVQRWSLIGAAWVTVVSYFVTFFMAEMIGRKILLLKYPWKKMVLVAFLWILILLVVKSAVSVLKVNYAVSLLLSSLGLVAFFVFGIFIQGGKGISFLLHKGKAEKVATENLEKVLEEEETFEQI
jgi:O-antigen/teichoic acid export membrane protein